jgi:hypothetical protein
MRRKNLVPGVLATPRSAADNSRVGHSGGLNGSVARPWFRSLRRFLCEFCALLFVYSIFLAPPRFRPILGLDPYLDCCCSVPEQFFRNSYTRSQGPLQAAHYQHLAARALASALHLSQRCSISRPRNMKLMRHSRKVLRGRFSTFTAPLRIRFLPVANPQRTYIPPARTL